MSDEDAVIAFFSEMYHDKDFRKIRPGRTGQIINDVVQHPMLNAPVGKLWIRDKEDGDRGETLATIGMIDARIPDASVMLGELIPGGELVAYRPNYSDRSLAAWGGNLAAIGIPYKQPDMQIDPVRSVNIDEGQIHPSRLYPSGTLNVYIEPFWFNGVRYGDAEHDVGSANVPTGTNEMRWVIITCNAATGVYTTQAAAIATYSNPDDMPIVDPLVGLTSIVIPANEIPLAPPILLTEDQTEIIAANIQYSASRFEDVRNWLTPVGVVVADTTGAATGDVVTLQADGTYAVAPVSPGAAVYPKRATMWHDESLFIAGGAVTRNSISLTHPYTTRTFTTTPAVDDEFTNSFSVASGTYTLSQLGVSGTNRGIITWFIDGVSQGTTDWYNATLVEGVVKTLSVTVVGDGYHKISGKLATKNASSTDYFAVLTKFWLAPSAD